MAAVLDWASDGEPLASHVARPARAVFGPDDLPPALRSAVWRGDQLSSPVVSVVPTGFATLDGELPVGGWPCHSVTEVLQAQPAVMEWRLLAPAMRSVVASGQDIVVVGPPKSPHLPGLEQVGLDQGRLVWLQAETPAERLWVTEQLVRTNAAGLLVAWLPQARQEQIRRLQVAAQTCTGPVFLCRPALAVHEPSAAPLRVQLRFSPDWELHLHIVKRKGPTHEGIVVLPSIPGGLESILTPRLRRPSALIAARAAVEVSDALGGTAPRRQPARPVATH